MVYPNYNKVFVVDNAIELQGWPLPGPVRNPGFLSIHEASTLLTAMQEKRCFWRKLSDDEHASRVADLLCREANGEQVFKPRKRR